MKSLYVSLAFITTVLFVTSASAQTPLHPGRDRLIGPAHTLQIEFAEIATIDGKEVEIRRRPHQRIVYDRRGNEIERINFNEDGSIQNRAVHIIDAKGRISGWKEYEAVTGGSSERITNWSEWLYDERGNRVEARVYSGKDLSHRTIASYNAAGLKIEETMISDGGAWKNTKKYGYDSGGRLTSTLINTNGTIMLIEEAYDDAGNVISHKSSSPDGQRVASNVFDVEGREIERNSEDQLSKTKVETSYDSKGRVSRRVTHFEYKQPNISMCYAPEPGTVEFSYNERNELVEKREYSANGTLQRRNVSEYDGDGRMQSAASFNGDNIVVGKTIFEYDKWGNRVKTVNTSTDHLGKTTTHVRHDLVTYYKEK